MVLRGVFFLRFFLVFLERWGEKGNRAGIVLLMDLWISLSLCGMERETKGEGDGGMDLADG